MVMSIAAYQLSIPVKAILVNKPPSANRHRYFRGT